MKKTRWTPVPPPPGGVRPIPARTPEGSVTGPASSAHTTPKTPPASTQPTKTTPAIAHGNMSARRRTSGAAGSPEPIGAAQRDPIRTPTSVSPVNATTEKTISGQVTSGPAGPGGVEKKKTEWHTGP